MTLFSHSSNRLLASLARSDAEAIWPHLDTIELPQETVLFEDGDPIGRVYFPHTGIVSLLVDLASGEMIETGMIGRDSLVGGVPVLDGTVALNRAVVQAAGTASVLPAEQASSGCRAKHRIPDYPDPARAGRPCLIATVGGMQCNTFP